MATSKEVCSALLQMIKDGKNPVDVFLGRGIAGKSSDTTGYYPTAPELDVDLDLLNEMGLAESEAELFTKILLMSDVTHVINPVNIYHAIVNKQLPNISSIFVTKDKSAHYDVNDAIVVYNGSLTFIHDNYVRGISKSLNEISLAYLTALCRRMCKATEPSAYGVSLVPSQDMLARMRRISEYREHLQRMSTSALFDAARSKIPDQALRRALVEVIMDPSQFME